MKKTDALVILLFSVLAWIPAARADFEMLPESRDQQYRTFGLFIDNQTQGLFEPATNNIWLSLGEQIALVEFKDWYGSPQLVAFAGVNAGDTLGGPTILMETIDIRAGLSYEFSFNDKQRMAISWEHQSGHTSDSLPVQDSNLRNPNLGNEELLFRYFHDVKDKFRLGATIKPFVGSDPGIARWGSDEFAEWFPWGTASSYSKPTPFIAGSMEQYGRYAVQQSYNIEAGVYFGNHLDPVHKPNVRLAIGYYSGVDPRFKYAQFDNSFQSFWYLGAQVGL